MEPFAARSQRSKLNLHWWVTAGVAAAFFVWSFDLIPRVRSAATGTVASGPKSGPAESLPDLEDLQGLSGDWSDISEIAGDLDAPESMDPLLVDSRTRSKNKRQSKKQNSDLFSHEASISSSSYETTDRSDDGVIPASYGGAEASESVSGPEKTTSPQKTPVLPAEMAEQLKDIDDWIASDRILDAHAELSKLYWKHPHLRPVFQDRIDSTAGMIFTTAERLFGPPHFVEPGETLDEISQQYDVPWMYLARMNNVSPENLQAGQKLKVVRGPFGAVVDLHDFTLTIHAHGWYVNHYAIGTGKDDRTPLGEFTVREKLENPTWYNPDGGIVEPDDPENPLGEYWLGLGDHIGIHGTNDPSTIGRAASRGCIHLNDDDITEVFSLLSSGSKVLIRR